MVAGVSYKPGKAPSHREHSRCKRQARMLQRKLQKRLKKKNWKESGLLLIRCQRARSNVVRVS